MIEVTTKEDRAKFYSSSQWKKLRLQVLERDHYECQWCKEQGKVTTINDAILEVDHIKELEYHPELATDIDNLRTLCKECWIWVNTSDTICENFFEIPAGEYLIVSTSRQTKTVWPLIEAMKLKPCGNLAKKM